MFFVFVVGVLTAATPSRPAPAVVVVATGHCATGRCDANRSCGRTVPPFLQLWGEPPCRRKSYRSKGKRTRRWNAKERTQSGRTHANKISWVGRRGGAKAFSRSDHAPNGKPTLASSLFSARAPRRRRTFLNGFLISSSAGFFAASLLPLASSSSSASSACRGDDGAYTYCFTGGPLGARHHPPGEHVNMNSTRVTRLLEQVGQVGVDRAWEREEMAHK